MARLDREFLRKLSEWDPGDAVITSLYLDVDGRKYPRRQDLEVRVDDLCRKAKAQAEEMGREARKSVDGDCSRIRQFFDALERGQTRGVALFSASSAGLWEEVAVPTPLPDRVRLAKEPHLLPLEALVEAYESFCTVLVDREKARLFFVRMAEIEEERDVFDEVPGQHEQGGWSQARYQRHIDDVADKHLRHVADVLLGYQKRRDFDHLILAGPEELLPVFEGVLHDYLKRKIVARVSLPMIASPDQVLEKSLAVEEELEARRERETLEQLHAEAAAGRQAALGMEPVLEALNDGRVATLVVPFGMSAAGKRCSSCGRLAANGSKCKTCGGALIDVADIVEAAVGSALQQSSRVETLSDPADGEQIGALLRY